MQYVTLSLRKKVGYLSLLAFVLCTFPQQSFAQGSDDEFVPEESIEEQDNPEKDKKKGSRKQKQDNREKGKKKGSREQQQDNAKKDTGKKKKTTAKEKAEGGTKRGRSNSTTSSEKHAKKAKKNEVSATPVPQSPYPAEVVPYALVLPPTPKPSTPIPSTPASDPVMNGGEEEDEDEEEDVVISSSSSTTSTPTTTQSTQAPLPSSQGDRVVQNTNPHGASNAHTASTPFKAPIPIAPVSKSPAPVQKQTTQPSFLRRFTYPRTSATAPQQTTRASFPPIISSSAPQLLPSFPEIHFVEPRSLPFPPSQTTGAGSSAPQFSTLESYCGRWLSDLKALSAKVKSGGASHQELQNLHIQYNYTKSLKDWVKHIIEDSCNIMPSQPGETFEHTPALTVLAINGRAGSLEAKAALRSLKEELIQLITAMDEYLPRYLAENTERVNPSRANSSATSSSASMNDTPVFGPTAQGYFPLYHTGPVPPFNQTHQNRIPFFNNPVPTPSAPPTSTAATGPITTSTTTTPSVPTAPQPSVPASAQTASGSFWDGSWVNSLKECQDSSQLESAYAIIWRIQNWLNEDSVFKQASLHNTPPWFFVLKDYDCYQKLALLVTRVKTGEPAAQQELKRARQELHDIMVQRFPHHLEMQISNGAEVKLIFGTPLLANASSTSSSASMNDTLVLGPTAQGNFPLYHGVTVPPFNQTHQNRIPFFNNPVPTPSAPPTSTAATGPITTSTTTTPSVPVTAQAVVVPDPATHVIVDPSFETVKTIATKARRGDLVAQAQVADFFLKSQYIFFFTAQRLGIGNWQDLVTDDKRAFVAACLANSNHPLLEQIKGRATLENPSACLTLARAYFKNNQYGKAIALLKSLVEQKNTAAESFLALIYMTCSKKSISVENLSDSELKQKILELFTNSATHGYPKSQEMLGRIYVNGLDFPVEKDFKKGREWYTKAAQQGNVRAQHELYEMYKKGTGIEGLPEPDRLKIAVEWCKQAAAQGNLKANTVLGRAYRNGIGVPKNQALAFYHGMVGKDPEDQPFLQSCVVSYKPVEVKERDESFADRLTRIKTGKKLIPGEEAQSGIVFIHKWGQDKLQQAKAQHYRISTIVETYERAVNFTGELLPLVYDFESINPAFFGVDGLTLSQQIIDDIQNQPNGQQLSRSHENRWYFGEEAIGCRKYMVDTLNSLEKTLPLVCKDIRDLATNFYRDAQLKAEQKIFKLQNKAGNDAEKDKKYQELTADAEKWKTAYGETMGQAKALEDVWNLIGNWAPTARNRQDLFLEEIGMKKKR